MPTINPLKTVSVAFLLTTCAAAATAQQQVQSAAELLVALQAAGIDVSAVASPNDDGTVTVNVPQAEAAPAPTVPAAQATQAQARARASAPAAAAASAPAVVVAEPAAAWDHKVELGFGASFGNTENASLSLGYKGQRLVEDRSDLKWDMGYYYEEDDSQTTENKLTAGVNHDWLNPGSKWIMFAGGRWDYDQFQDWDHRASANVGLGYKFIEDEDFQLTFRGGAGAAQEFGGPDDDIKPEAMLGADFAWNISENQSLVGDTRVFPSLDEGGEFRSRSTVTYNIDIAQGDGLSIFVGLLHEYDSDVTPSTDEHDLKVTGGLGFDF